ncbi:Unknown protein [Striga hermonthica]|uniref:Uncharacterized protein n=1 Tax=Striga hermonthica TaxID=68872 RepID=A0A9N7NED7_STRHE|nr:Unknown protein [Striga hermonthica]
MKMKFQGFIWNVLVHEKPLVVGNAIANEGDKMTVVHTGDDFNLGLELSLSLAAPSLEALDGHDTVIGQDSLVHVTKPPLPYKVSLTKPVCGRCKLLIA